MDKRKEIIGALEGKFEFEYICDMASIKILFTDKKGNPAGSCFFDNGIGDGEYKVYICKSENEANGEFVGHFTSFGNAYLMYSDCDNDNKQYKFEEGRWWVQLDNDGNFYIYKQDEDLHA